MGLVSAVLGFFLRKLGLFGAILLSLFVGFLLVQAFVPAIREAMADRDRLEQVTKERLALESELDQLERDAAQGQSAALASVETRIEAEVEDGQRNVAAKKGEIDRLRDEESEVCGPVQKVIAKVFAKNACKAAQVAKDRAVKTLGTLEGSLSAAQSDAAVLADSALTPEQKLDKLGQGGLSPIARQITNTESELEQKRAEESSLESAQARGLGWLVDQWAKSWRWLAVIAISVLVVPIVLRVISYFLLMPLVKRAHKPIHLAAETDYAAADLRTSDAHRTLKVDLDAGEVLSARSEHVRPVAGKTRSQLLYRWRAPFISFASGLHGLTRVTGDGGATSATLAAPDDADSYLMRIDFCDHPGIVMHPKHVVGVVGHPTLKTRWRWGLQSFATWQVRYIMFAGTGSLVIAGTGDVVTTRPEGRPTRMDQNLVMGFDSRLTAGVDRNEIFWSYLRGKTPLVVHEFTGPHPLFWQKSTHEGASSPLARTFNALFSALGKLLGF